MKILIIEDDEGLREAMSFILELELGAEVETASSVTDAKRLLFDGAGHSLILCDFQIEEATGEDVFAHLQTLKSRPPFILWSAADSSRHPFFKHPGIAAVISKTESYEKLAQTMRRLLKAPEPGAIRPLQDYCRIRVSSLLRLGTVICDCYLKLAEDRFIRVLREGDEFGRKDSERFEDKGMTFLFLRREDSQKLISALTRDLAQISDAQAATVEEVYGASVSTMETISGLIQALGFTEEVQQIAKSNVTLAVKNMQANPVLAGLLERLMLDPERYLASHSVILCYVACAIASLLDWKSDTTYYKLTLASFMHDIVLTDQALAQKQTLPEIYGTLGQFPQQEVEAYLQHPKSCAELIRSMRDIPPDVDTIVQQHHERPDGTGFPAGANHSTISPLAAVLILSHELLAFRQANETQNSKPEDMQRFMQELGPDYQRGVFRPLFIALEESVTKQLAPA